MKDIIKNILLENQELDLSSRLLPRKTDLTLGLDKIQAIIGPRRVGKTTTLLLAIDELKTEKRIPVSNILYFNFEDERIQFEQSSLNLLLQAWQELYPNTNLSNMWFFLDEVQAAPGWEKFLNRINENYTGRIVFTGSNSAVLHTHIKSVLRGRSIAVELLPLSFKIYCGFKKFTPAIYGEKRAETNALFLEYLEKGGYPETVNLEQGLLHTSYLQEYYNAMLLRDIVEYNQLTNYSYLRELYRHTANSIGKKISIRRFYNQLKSQGYKVGVNSVYDAMDFAEQAYLYKRISHFDYSEMKRSKSDKKIYWIDNGLLNANTTRFSKDKGLLFENAIFWELYRRYGTIYNANIYYYSESNAECDFIIYREGESPIPVQVSWSISDPETRQREIKGLLKASAYCQVKSGWVITAEEEEQFSENGIEIFVKAGWKWMLE